MRVYETKVSSFFQIKMIWFAGRSLVFGFLVGRVMYVLKNISVEPKIKLELLRQYWFLGPNINFWTGKKEGKGKKLKQCSANSSLFVNN